MKEYSIVISLSIYNQIQEVNEMLEVISMALDAVQVVLSATLIVLLWKRIKSDDEE